MVPRCTMMKPTTTPARANRDDAVSRSSGNSPVMKPMRKMIDATNRLDSRPFVFLATNSPTVQTAITITNATMGFTCISSTIGSQNGHMTGTSSTATARKSNSSGSPSFQ